MASRVLVAFENGRYKGRASSADTLDFLVVRIGASNLPIAEAAGHFDFGAKKLTNIGTPGANGDAATKLYVDTADGLKVNKAGDTMTGALDFGGTQKVTGLAAPSSANDATRKVYVDDADALRVLKAGDTMSGNLDMGGNSVTNLGAPSGANDAARKSYVDAVVNGLDVKHSVRVATTGALPAATYGNGTLGVGATLTGNVNGALPAQDGITLVVNDRILVKDQAAALQNGLYKVTQVGDGGSVFILTRVVDADEAAEVSGGMFAFVEEGTLYADTGWVCTVDGAVTVGTTALPFSQFSSAGLITAGLGLSQTGNQFDVNVDDATIEINADTLRVKDDGITESKLADDAVSTDKIVDAAVTEDKLADDAVTQAKIADQAVGFDEIEDGAVDATKLDSITSADPFHTGISQNDDNEVVGFDAENWTADDAVVQGEVVFIDSTSGNAKKADVTHPNLPNEFLGIVKSASIPGGNTGSGEIYFRIGTVIGGFTGLTQGARQYVSRATPGALTESLAGFVAGEHVYSVGRALSSTDIMLDPQFIIEMA